MKTKILFIIAFLSVAFTSNAQNYYNKKMYVDNSGNVKKTERQKTLITKTDSTFVIVEKGKQPIVWLILNVSNDLTLGSKENIVRLVDDVYGYQTAWSVIRLDQKEEYAQARQAFIDQPNDENMRRMSSFWLYAVQRVVAARHTGTYVSDVFWLSDESHDDKLGKNISRVVYSK